MTRGLGLFILTSSLVALIGCNQVEARIAADKGYRSYLAKQFDESIQQYENARAAAPENKTILRNLSYAYLASGRESPDKELAKSDFDKAIVLLTDLLKQDPKDMEVASVLLDAWMQSDRLDDAAIFFQNRTLKDPNDLEALRLLGVIELQRGNYEEALKVYEKRRDLKPDDIQIYSAIATLCWEWLRAGGPDNPQAAVEVATKGFNAAIEADRRDPKHPTALVYAGLLLRERAKRQTDPKESEKDIAAAQDIYKKAKARNPSPSPADKKEGQNVKP